MGRKPIDARNVIIRVPTSAFERMQDFRDPANPTISDSQIAAQLVIDGLRYRGYRFDKESNAWTKPVDASPVMQGAAV